MADFSPITRADPVFSLTSTKAVRGIQSGTFLRAAGLANVDGLLGRAPYRDVFGEGAQTFVDDNKQKCLVYNAYSGDLLQAMMGMWPTSIKYTFERYRGPAFPNGDYGVAMKMSGGNRLAISVHRPFVYLVRLD